MSGMNSRAAEFMAMLERYRAGKATAEESAFINSYFEQMERQPDILDNYSAEEKEILRQELWVKLKEEMHPVAVSDEGHLWRNANWRVAAAIALLVAMTGLTYKLIKHHKHAATISDPVMLAGNDIQPGGNRATLTLADGSVIGLDSARNGRLAKQGNAAVLKVGTGELVYSTQGAGTDSMEYNLLTTPVAGQYKLVLPDSSIVWLNSSSSLRYPSNFAGRERRVTLTGEGYFEVKHRETQPFIVDVGSIEVRDLGTEFNINSYSDEPGVQTTLINGLASVTSKGKTFSLSPGEAVLARATTMEKVSPSIASVTGWKNGMFLFEKERLDNIMRQVARWYDAEIIFEKPIDKYFVASIPRNVPVSRLLHLFEETGGVHFTIDGKTITVKP